MSMSTDPDFLALAKEKDVSINRIVDVESSANGHTYFLLAEHEDGCRNIVALTVLNSQISIVHPETELRHVNRKATRGDTEKRIWPSKSFGARASEKDCELHVSTGWRAQL